MQHSLICDEEYGKYFILASKHHHFWSLMHDIKEPTSYNLLSSAFAIFCAFYDSGQI